MKESFLIPIFLFQVIGFCVIYFLLDLFFGKEHVWYEIVAQGVVALAIMYGIRYLHANNAK